MKNIIIACASALAAVACGNTDPKPVQDPSNVTTTSSPSSAQTSTTTSTSPASPATPDGSTTSTAGTAAAAHSNGYDPTRKASVVTLSSGTTASDTAHGTNGAAGPVSGTAPAPGAPAVNNPGVADQSKDADNTKVNDRDRHGALTATDQGNSSAETKITAAIRRTIVADKTLSLGAKNVKIITVGNKVTLRGPVKSEQEKSAIEAAAKQTSGVGEVDNQLEIKK